MSVALLNASAIMALLFIVNPIIPFIINRKILPIIPNIDEVANLSFEVKPPKVPMDKLISFDKITLFYRKFSYRGK